MNDQPSGGHSMPVDLQQAIQQMPKVELHRHLEGSLRLETLVEIARQHRIDLPGYGVEDIRPLVQMMPHDPPSAAAYLSKFAMLRRFYRSPEIIDRVVYEAIADAAADGVVYFEMRFTPIALAREMGFALTDVFRWVLAAARRGERDTGIIVRLLVSMNRHESPEIGAQFVELAIAHQADGMIVGVDLAGAESSYHTAPFAPVFYRARQAGLAVTCHAGEWAGPENVLEAIEMLGAQRVGHGVRVMESQAAIALARERGVTFEVCPTSNVQSGVAVSWDTHPLRAMYQAGLLTSIHTDNTLVSGITLSEELIRAAVHLGFTLDDLQQQTLNAARAAFLSAAGREILIDRLRRAFVGQTAPTSDPPL